MRLGGLSLSIALIAVALATPVSATIGTIQPGDQMSSSIGGCTLNFVYDGVGAYEGRVFIGTAAHCVSHVGESIDSWPYDGFGTVAALGSAGGAVTDWAVIEVAPEFHHLVKAAVKGHPAYPTGVTSRAIASTGEPIQLSGYGMLFGTAAPTQEKRVGILTDYTADLHRVVAPVVFGDSGGPIVHIPTGTALGLNSRIPVGCPCTEYGPTIEGLLRQAAQKGLTLELRTVS